MLESVLCIGGPRDGQTVEIDPMLARKYSAAKGYETRVLARLTSDPPATETRWFLVADGMDMDEAARRANDSWRR